MVLRCVEWLVLNVFCYCFNGLGWFLNWLEPHLQQIAGPASPPPKLLCGQFSIVIPWRMGILI